MSNIKTGLHLIFKRAKLWKTVFFISLQTPLKNVDRAADYLNFISQRCFLTLKCKLLAIDLKLGLKQKDTPLKEI